MQTLSSASRTFIARASAVECTATVLIPISRQARWIRSAISPRLAIRTFSNISLFARSLDQHQDGAVFDRLRIRDHDLRDATRPVGENLVHHLHRLDDQERLALGDQITEAHEGWGSRLRRQIGGPDNRGLYGAGMLDRSGGDRSGRGGAGRRRWRPARMRRSPIA